jgi:hypothetical protein
MRALIIRASISWMVVAACVPAAEDHAAASHDVNQRVFERAASALAQVAYGKASNPDAGDRFGGDISLSGDTLVVGASLEDSSARGINGNQASNSASGAGAVYVFVRNGTTWSQQAYLKASNIGASDGFGTSVSLLGDTLAVGAPSEASAARGINGDQNDNSALGAGAAYVFQRSGTQWTQQAYIKASNTDANDHFGNRLALSGNTLAVAAFGEASVATGVDGDQNDNSGFDAGAVYVFQRTAQTWAQQAYLKASNTRQGAKFGTSIALSGETLAVGANQDADGGDATGAVYVFVRSAAQWIQQAYLKASNVFPGEFFGDSVALAGDRLLVGATGESSRATGVNGDQNDRSFLNAGAAYLFARSGELWTQQAYLKASNTHAPVTDRLDRVINDLFGSSVAVSDTAVVVGAFFEFGGSAGINGNQTDRSKQQAGAIYIFQ